MADRRKGELEAVPLRPRGLGDDTRRAEPAQVSGAPVYPGLIAAGSDRSRMTVSPRLAVAVARLLVRSFTPAIAEQGGGHGLLVIGKPGTGKTSQVIAILSRLNVDTLFCSAPLELAGPHEGDSAAGLGRVAAVAMARTRETGGALAVVIDEPDLVIGGSATTTHTVNKGLLEGALQNALDGRSMHAGFDGTATPLPIILLVNDGAGLRSSLCRPGRCSVFVHCPSEAEVAAQVGGLFPELTGVEAASLVAAFCDKPIAWFADLRVRLLDGQIDALIGAHGMDFAALDRAVRANKAPAEAAIWATAETMAAEVVGTHL